MVTLVAHKNVCQGHLNVLEVENDSLALDKHMVDQVSLGGDDELTKLLFHVYNFSSIAVELFIGNEASVVVVDLGKQLIPLRKI